MKPVFYTQRADVVESYGERRDCADQRLCEFLRVCRLLPVPVPNNKSVAEAMCEALRPKGIFLSGGNSLAAYGGNAPERDATEKALVDYAIQENLPVFGICRGLQFLADYFGSRLEEVEGHVRTRHRVKGDITRSSVNSFHQLAALELKPPLAVLSRAEDGTVEALRHSSLPILAVGWHPEREREFDAEDIELITEWFGKEW